MGGNKVLVIDDTVHSPLIAIEHLFCKRRCQKYIEWIEEKEKERVQYIGVHRDLADAAWEKLKDCAPQNVKYDGHRYELVGLSDYVTVSKHVSKPIGIHRDEEGRNLFHGKFYRDYVCLYKVAVYLNDVSDPDDPEDITGGTTFYDEDRQKILTIKPRPGRAVIFDLRELHSGAPIPKGRTKYMLGFRLMYTRV